MTGIRWFFIEREKFWAPANKESIQYVAEWHWRKKGNKRIGNCFIIINCSHWTVFASGLSLCWSQRTWIIDWLKGSKQSRDYADSFKSKFKLSMCYSGFNNYTVEQMFSHKSESDVLEFMMNTGQISLFVSKNIKYWAFILPTQPRQNIDLRFDFTPRLSKSVHVPDVIKFKMSFFNYRLRSKSTSSSLWD